MIVRMVTLGCLMSMVTETLWPIEPHTAKKHEILKRYFQAWLPILGHSNKRLLYIDAFAGPGKYIGGEDGSPLVVLKAARDHSLKLKSELRCIFVEDKPARFDHLQMTLDEIRPTLTPNISFRALKGKFTDHLSNIFSEVQEQVRCKGPTLAFVDPFGYSQTPFQTIARLLRCPKSEVLVNFMYGDINRFLGVPERAQHFDNLFGTSAWRDIVNHTDPVYRLYAIHDLYLAQLRTVARYVKAFLMVNLSNAPDYFLFFATNSEKGLEAMLEAMWKVDPASGYEFSDFTDAKKQPLLFAPEPDYALLKQVLIQEFRRASIEFTDMSDWVLEWVGFLRSHVRTALGQLEEEGVVTVPDANRKRPPYTYPPGTVVKFR
jgi:three-Cys-motif partner protein